MSTLISMLYCMKKSVLCFPKSCLRISLGFSYFFSKIIFCPFGTEEYSGFVCKLCLFLSLLVEQFVIKRYFNIYFRSKKEN